MGKDGAKKATGKSDSDSPEADIDDSVPDEKQGAEDEQSSNGQPGGDEMDTSENQIEKKKSQVDVDAKNDDASSKDGDEKAEADDKGPDENFEADDTKAQKESDGNDDDMEIDNDSNSKNLDELKGQKETPTSIRNKIQVEEDNDDDDDDGEEDPFGDFLKMHEKTVKKPKKKKAHLQIKINVLSPKNATQPTIQEVTPREVLRRTDSEFGSISAAHSSLLDKMFSFDPKEVENQLEDSLQFFEQPHQDQDPLYAKFCRDEKKRQIALALKKIDIDEAAGKKEIEMVVAHQLKEKQSSTQKSVDKYKLKTSAEEKNDMALLHDKHAEKVRSNQTKIDHGMIVLRKRHAQENQKLMQQHRQQVQQRRVSQETASAEWAQLSQRLHTKHQRQIAEFAAKGEEVKKKCEAEFHGESTRLRKQYEKRLQDVDANRQSLYNRIYAGFQQLRQRYLKRHAQAMARRREALLSEAKESQHDKEHGKKSTPDKAKGEAEEKEETRPPSPLKTSAEWYKDSQNKPSGAAARHKHRKGVLSQINKQLSVEIHNEGIWISQLKTDDANKKKGSSEANGSADSDEKLFIPWGVQAREPC
ncbi:MAG: hypothetical protein SGILL_000027 [Bacillariaceae sp.]